MKFLTLIAAVSAVRISQKSTSKVALKAKGPRQEAEQAIEECDKSGNGELSKKEVFDCVKKDVPAEHHQAVKDFINQIWPHVDTDGSGEVSADEIEAFIRGMQGSLAQIKRGGPSPADIVEECDTSGNGELSKKEVHDCINAHVPQEHQEEAHQMVDEVWDMVDTNGNGEIDEHELAAAMRHGPPSLAKKGGPSPADIIDACDANGSGGIDLEEAHACIDAHITDPDENAQAHEMVDAGFEHVDKNGDGEIDEHELSKAMRAHSLVQTLRGDPSPADVMAECDTSGNGKLTKKEVKACIKKHVPPEYEEHVDEAVDAVWDMVDTDGSGEVDMGELEAAMANM